ncbi:MAG: hypothetical protein ABFC56_06660, partial [Clostridiaceae bacterium]
MGDAQFPRIKVRALLHKLNNHVIVSLILVGFFVGLMVATIIATFFYPLIGVTLFPLFLIIRHTLRHIKNVNSTKNPLSDSFYPTQDKTYIWSLESNRD